MADWHGAARTNYFPVKDAEAFKAWAAAASLVPFEDAASGLWGLYSATPSGGWPDQAVGADGADRHFDLVRELAAHVGEDWPVVLMESGSEKARIVTGTAIAMKVSSGAVSRITISLEDIYWLAQSRWGAAPTRCAG